jgi:hypothetical protein
MSGQRDEVIGGGEKAAMRAIQIWIAAGLLGVVGGLSLIGILKELGIILQTDDDLRILGACGLFATVAAIVSTYMLIRRDSPGLTFVRANLWRYVILGLLPIAALALGVLIYSAIPAAQFAAGIAILLAAGVIGLLLALAVVAVFFQALAITDKNEALGLPRGSVRAVIALALILVFAIMSVYVYSVEDLANKADIAKQLVTTLSTLVVAVAAFYFGSKSVEAAAAAVGPAAGGRALTISPSKAIITAAAGGTWTPAKLDFKPFPYPPNAMIQATVLGDDASTISAANGVWTYQPKQPSPGGVGINFSHTDDPATNALVSIEVRSATDPTIAPAGGPPPGEAPTGSAPTQQMVPDMSPPLDAGA